MKQAAVKQMELEVELLRIICTQKLRLIERKRWFYCCYYSSQGSVSGAEGEAFQPCLQISAEHNDLIRRVCQEGGR